MKHIYSLRKNFTIIGLTGSMGNGCSKVAELLSSNKELFFENLGLRKPDQINLVDSENKIVYDSVLFQRKYKICYNFMELNWKKYIFIDYKKVLLLYCFNYIVNIKKSKNFKEDTIDFIVNNFRKAAINDKDDFDDSNKRISKTEILEILNEVVDFEEFESELKGLRTINGILELKNSKKLKSLYNLFFVKDSNFNKLFRKTLNLFTNKNYYLRVLFFHRIACNIRNTGNPEEHGRDENMDNVYNLARLINRLIKAYKTSEEGKQNCHIVINSLKNSLEIMYFKERYSAFYMMAIHGQSKNIKAFNNIVKSEVYKEKTVEKLINIDTIEYKTGDFKNGIFSSPDIENCIQKSEIHIVNPRTR